MKRRLGVSINVEIHKGNSIFGNFLSSKCSDLIDGIFNPVCFNPLGFSCPFICRLLDWNKRCIFSEGGRKNTC